MSHTPGPWRSAITASVVGRTVWRGDLPKNNNYKRICRNISTQADASLIAAAPELLSSLQALVKAEEEYGEEGNVSINEALLPAYSAIKKALGK